MGLKLMPGVQRRFTAVPITGRARLETFVFGERWPTSSPRFRVDRPLIKGFFRLVVSTGNLKNTRQEKDWKTRMKINLCIAAVLLATLVLTAGCAVDPYASGPDMGTEIPPGGAPASGTGYR
jgi:hypothetical protein